MASTKVGAFLLLRCEGVYPPLAGSALQAEGQRFDPVSSYNTCDSLRRKLELFYLNSVLIMEMQEIIDALIKFRNDRDWEQFHNPKDLALAISVEAGELLELFLWKKPEEANLAKVREELADILVFALLLAEKYKLDVKEIILDKIAKNSRKYPVEKSKGNSKKYDEL
jgi:NTP pyrophosphatase (non-canonical NTP hydrolase)